ncbi:hypothetical protein EMIHUDRAFT_61107 [Emiliania huxleyi CCMP1516]|uniref:EF-hand domain-containing protein n=2 Tax=Emiliania huxleyi TaxID=2903 RepID=A0A0D3L1F5_EMIH1|nr:hypothetical protein EMIHUDRAFT_61107 [Emiliania huxleyi CCMP1516]EOD41840.1 hypothetical protein EMIHUDRAFT_61107 [Emiliania huxleyi CCMP1516]|eukprot:XP_005794269.1 hypothetical protein EMIHUDRAFT_61107 [Emiliania huxleyi CCMP1516]
MAGSGSHLDAFDLFDKNHDGKISKNELKAVMKDLGNPITDEEAIDIMHEAGSARTQAHHQPLLLDKAANAPGAASEEQQLREAFSLFDKDGDGKISKKEMKNAVAAFGLELNDRETGLLLDEMNLLVAAKGGDKNSISYELFKKVLLQG